MSVEKPDPGPVAGAGASPAAQVVTTFVGHIDGWNTVTADDGFYALDDAWLAVYGDQASVTFLGADDQVSFYGPSNGYDDDVVDGSGGTVIAVRAHVTLSGADNLIFFDPSDDVLNVSSAATAWNTLYASSGTVNLNGGSLNILGAASPTHGDVVTINALAGVSALSLYQNGDNLYVVNGDDVTVTLTDALADVKGSSDVVWFSGGSGSAVTLDMIAGQFDTVYGSGTVYLSGGGVVSVGGGVLVDLLSAGGVADLSYTQGVWDQVVGAAGTLSFRYAQASVYGGAQTLDFVIGDDNAASLYQTDGNWDSVYGDASVLIVVSAQANIYGAIGDVYLDGAGSQVSVYGDDIYSTTRVHADDDIVISNQASIDVIGGGDTLYANPFGYNDLQLSASNGVWDTVYMQNQYLALMGAQASVFGGGDTVYEAGAGDAVSLYGTLGNDDSVEGAGAVTLNDAGASLYGANFFVYFGAGANSVSLGYSEHDDVLTFVGAFGRDTVSNLAITDTLVVSKTQFADFNAFAAALAQQGDNCVLTLDRADSVTFLNTQASTITAAQVRFV